MKKGMLSFTVAAILLVTLLMSACVSNTDRTVTVGEDSVPSLYSIVGERKVTGTSKGFDNNVDYVTLSYNDGDVTKDDVYDYTQALRDAGYLLLQDVDLEAEQLSVYLGKASSEEGKIIIVNIEYSLGNSVQISYKTGAGTVTEYEDKNLETDLVI